MDSILLNRSVTCMQILGAHLFQILLLILSQPGALLGAIHESTSQTSVICREIWESCEDGTGRIDWVNQMYSL